MTDVPPFRTLPLDERSERSVALLRLAAAASVLLGAGWLAYLRPAAYAWVCVAAGLGGAALWVALGLRARSRIRRAADHRLELAPAEVRLFDGNHRARVAWHEITTIDVDEDRLVVVLRRRQEEPLTLEPRYGGLGVYRLRDALEAARLEGCHSSEASLQLSSHGTVE